MRTIARAALLASTIAASSGPALAWDEEGHRVVALVAEHYLSPAAKAKLEAMLKTDPDMLTAHDIASEAIWADKLQNSDKDTTRQHYNATAAWHFADIEATRPNIPEACFGQPPLAAGTPASQGPAKACVIDKINQFAAELADPKTSAAERLLAVKFLLSLVADAHQPLRVADEQNDHGAAIHVVAGGITPGDLFGYWDGAFVHSLGPDAKTVADHIVAHISDADAAQWASGAAQLWALEAHQLGVDHAYGFSGAVDDQGRVALSDRDVADGVKTVSLQLGRAGVRLAYVLDQALAPEPEPAKPTVVAGDKAAGRRLAQVLCSVCHVVAPDQTAPREFTNAPDFAAIANTSGMSEVALHEFLFGPHPTMPQFVLSQKQAGDLAAFIMSLRKGS